MQNLYVYDVGSRLFVFPAGKSAGSVRKPAALPTGARRSVPIASRFCAPDVANPCVGLTDTENSAVMPVIFTADLRLERKTENAARGKDSRHTSSHA